MVVVADASTLSSWRGHIRGGHCRSSQSRGRARPGAERAAGPGRPAGLHPGHRLLPRRRADRLDAGRRQHAADHRRRASGPSPTPAARSRSPARGSAWTAPPSSTCWRSTTRQTRLQVDQGRIDVKTFDDRHQPALRDRDAARHDLAAAAGRLLRRGGLDRGSDAARRALRRGADPGASNGQVLAVRAGEVGEVTGDGSTPQLRTIQSAAAAACRVLGRAATARSSTTSRRSICRPASPATRT